MVQPKRKKLSASGWEQESLLNRITTRIRQSLELQEILTTTVVEIRSFLRTDRVKIYRFHPDGSGEVIAESINGDQLPSLLGLRFPAEDIPPYSREMFIKSRQRVIVDVGSGQKILNQLDCPQTGKSLVVEDICYSPVDPCHQEYLTAMGVAASLVVPILHQNQLWGLLVSHHPKPRHFSERELKLIQLLVDQVSIAIAQSDLLAQARQQAHHEATINQISRLLHSPLEITEIRQSVLEQTVKGLEGVGGRLYITAEPTGEPAQIFTCGEQPTIPWLEESPLWQEIMGCLNYTPTEADTEVFGVACKISPVEDPTVKTIQPYSPDSNINNDFLNNKNLVSNIYIIENIYQENLLQPLIPAFQTSALRSLLIVPLQYHQQCVGCLTIFRNEIETETIWAGVFNQDQRNLRPRTSFEAWREIKKGQSKAWTDEEINLAKSLSIHLYMAVMQRRVEDMIKHQASHDHLTGLPNRLLFNDRLSLELANAHHTGKMLAVIFLDLDGFKNINDTLGHAIGDRLLQSVAQRLKSCLREADIVARWGGDEFTLLLSPITCTKDAVNVAQRILWELSLPFLFEGQQLYAKASLGISLAPYDGEDAETLLKNADAAMYRAKQQGRNNYQLYTPAIGNKVLERMLLENNLYTALEKKQFLLYYQPQLDLITGEIMGMEALIRWNRDGELISPNQFIALAEETGLICTIGEWVIRTACEQNKLWQQLGLPAIRVAVNLSARQFQQQTLLRDIANILKETQLEGYYLEVEITESIAMQNINMTISLLKALQNMGIQISMDDFGTGYSSLNSLKHFPLDVLKIDRSFIKDLMVDNRDAAIVNSVVALGHGLNLKIIAEGVETFEQLDFLRSINCDGIQGYLYSQPLSGEEATKFFQSQVSQVKI